MDKKGIELSVNFLVMFILAIVMFGFGMYFVTRMVGTSQEVAQGLPKMDDVALDHCLAQGEQVCMSKNKAETHPDKKVVFGIGINNDLDGTDKFILVQEIAKLFDDEGEEIPLSGCAHPMCSPFCCGDTLVARTQDEWVPWQESPPYTIPENENKKIPLVYVIRTGSQAGTYVWNVEVCAEDSSLPVNPSSKCPIPFKRYGGVHKIYITVV